MFRLYEATIIRLHVSELYAKESHTAVDVSQIIKISVTATRFPF